MEQYSNDSNLENDTSEEDSSDESSSVLFPSQDISKETQRLPMGSGESQSPPYSVLQISQTNSPFPDPEILKRYQEIGYDRELINFLGKEQGHRHKLEEQDQEHSQKMDKALVNNDRRNMLLEHQDQKRGQNYALGVTLSLILIGACLIASGRAVGGSIAVVTSSATGLASAFIQGRQNEKDKNSIELSNKQDDTST